VAAIRPGVAVSAVGHVGLVALTLMTWQAAPEILPSIGSVVPVEVVDIGEISNVRALSTQEGEEDAPLTAEEQQEEAIPEPAPAAEPAPRQTPRRQEDSFDLAAVAGMVNREQRQPRRQEGERADRNRQGAGAGTAETAAIEDRLRALARAHINRGQCWRMPIDLPNPETLVVTVQFDLNRNGTLQGQPRVISPSNYTFNPYMRTAAEAALRAVRACDPFPFADDPVVGDRYDLWRQMEYTFRPSL
jgi:hypothetical protein